MTDRFSLGQELLFEPVAGHRPRRPPTLVDLNPVTVTKLGRVWVTVATGRNTMRFEPEPDTEGLVWVDGGDWPSPGRIWRTREAYADYITRLAACEKIAAALRRGKVLPPEVQTDTLASIAALLPDAD